MFTGSDVFIHCGNAVFSFGVFSGMLYQIFLVSNLYFRYGVLSFPNIAIPEQSNSMAVTICIRYSDVLNYGLIRKRKKRSNWYYTTDPEITRKYSEDLLINEIFEYTPPETEVIKKLIFRRNVSHELVELKQTEVYKHFKVQKSIYLESVCYTISKIDGSDQKVESAYVSFAPIKPGIIYDIQLGSSLERTQTLRIVVSMVVSDNSPPPKPYRSLMMAPQTDRFYNDTTKSSRYNVFSVQQYIFLVNSLPPPYSTQCFDYRTLGHQTRVECIEECLKKKVEREMNQVPFNYMIRNKNLTIHKVAYLDVEKPDVSKIVFGAETFCQTVKCKSSPCWTAASSTRVNLHAGQTLTIRQLLPIEPSITIKTVPWMEFLDYFSYVTSIISTYTGVSALAFSPIVIVKHLYSYSKNRKCLEAKNKSAEENSFNSCNIGMTDAVIPMLRQRIDGQAEAIDQTITHLINEFHAKHAITSAKRNKCPHRKT